MDKIIIDANIILRIILNDNEKMTKDVLDFIEKNNVFIKNEVLAEVVYVLLKVYYKERTEIYSYIVQVITAENVSVESTPVILLVLKTFKDRNLDFVDSLLYAYHCIDGMEIFTFDKKLKRLINK